MRGLELGRVNHAYLFSGPRGCGKTTSARILARILNCAENTEANPISVPCGECESCLELGRGGSGSLDVVEIDAASHGGVDDARDLRERATFSPSRDRFKIFILDEAHMVSPAGFNALLKIVEEPPPYLKFIFATTEPDKVIGTIRSRTHHYPFRLVPPEVLQPYLDQLCAFEGIEVAPGVLPLVVRAGGGSVRDSLSVLDQLMAGAQGGQIDYDLAAGLLGFTPVTLLDDVVEALAGADGARLFRVVERIIATGHEPRRFVEDILERFRDLLVMSVSGEGAAAVFSSYPADQVERMLAQSRSLGVAQLSRAADVTNAALTDMVGATSPRLHLELLCARLLLPAGEDGLRAIAARVERLEHSEPAAVDSLPRARSAASADDTAAVTGSAPVVDAPPTPEQRSGGGRPAASEQSSAGPGIGANAGQPAPRKVSARQAAMAAAAKAVTGTTSDKPSGEAATPATATAPTQEPSSESATARVTASDSGPEAERAPAADAAPATAPEPERATSADSAPAPEPERAPAAEPAPASRVSPEDTPAPVRETSGPSGPTGDLQQSSPAVTAVETEVLTRRWDDVLAALAQLRKATWALVSQNATVGSLAGDQLTLVFPSAGLVQAFRSGNHADLVGQALDNALGVKVRVIADLRDGGPGEGGPGGGARGGPSGNSNSANRGGNAGNGSAGRRVPSDRAQADGSAAGAVDSDGRGGGPSVGGSTDGPAGRRDGRGGTISGARASAQAEARGGSGATTGALAHDPHLAADPHVAAVAPSPEPPVSEPALAEPPYYDEPPYDDAYYGEPPVDEPPPDDGVSRRSSNGRTADRTPSARPSSRADAPVQPGTDHSDQAGQERRSTRPPGDEAATVRPIGGIADNLPPIPRRRSAAAPTPPAANVRDIRTAHSIRERGQNVDGTPWLGDPAAQEPSDGDSVDQAAEDAWTAQDAVAIEDSGLVGAPLVAQLLGGVVIDEIIEHEA